jgi:membrane protein
LRPFGSRNDARSDEREQVDEIRDDDGAPVAPVRADYSPRGADDRPSLFATLRRTFTEFREDNLTDWAAALTYYGLLALFPAMIALVAIVGLFGDPQSTTETITDVVTSIGPQSAADTFADPIKTITSNRGGAGLAFVLGLLVALWSASGYVGAFMRASNVIYETPEGRPFWKLRPLQILVTVIMVLLLAVIATALVLTGPIVDAVAEPIGLSSTAVTVWNIAKWPVLMALFVIMISILYYASPNVKIRGFRWVTPGSVVALVVWIVASAAFAFYVANFGSYNKTYGTLAGMVVLLIWMWITNLAILLGHQFNAERERRLEIEEGVPRHRDDRSTAELLRQLSQQTGDLVRHEMELAKAELRAKAKAAGLGGGIFGGAGLLALYAVGTLTACAILVLATLVDAWLAALIVGAGYAALAGVLALIGRKKVEQATPPVPEQAIESSKEDVEWTKQRARAARR